MYRMNSRCLCSCFRIHTHFTVMRAYVLFERARLMETLCTIRTLVRLDVVVSIHVIDQRAIVCESFRTDVALMHLHLVVAAHVSRQLLRFCEILFTQFAREAICGRGAIRRCVGFVDFHVRGERFLLQKGSCAQTAWKRCRLLQSRR